MEVWDDVLNYFACIRADAETWSDRIEARWAGLCVCVCVCMYVILAIVGPAVHFMVASRVGLCNPGNRQLLCIRCFWLVSL